MPHDIDPIFEGITGETRRFNFKKNEESQKTKKKFIEALEPAVIMDIKRRTAQIEVKLPEIDEYFTKFIDNFSKFLGSFSSPNFANTFDLAQSRLFEANEKPLFLSILDLETEEIQNNEITEAPFLKFTQDFISNNNLTGIPKRIRSKLSETFQNEEDEDSLRALLKSISVECPQSLFKLETVAEPRETRPRKTEPKKDGSRKAKPKKESSSAKILSIREVTKNDKPTIICQLKSQKDQFLLLSLFRSDKENGPLVFERDEFESNLKTRIYERFLKIFSICVKKSSGPKHKYDKECTTLIDEFLENLIFKINQPEEEELKKYSYEKIQGLTEVMRREINESISLHMSEWLVSARTTKRMDEYHRQFQKIKMNLERVKLLRDTLPFIEDCEKKKLILNFSTLDFQNPLKKFLENENIDSWVFLLSEEGVGRSRLFAYQAISEIELIQTDRWAFIDIKVDRFQYLSKYLQSQDLQYIIIDIPIELSGVKLELLKEVLRIASEENKKVILLNTHVEESIKIKNLELITKILPDQGKFYQEKAAKFTPEQVQDACETSKEKYIFTGSKYRQLQDVLREPNCGLHKAMLNPQYLSEIISSCEKTKENQIDSQPLYINNDIVHLVPQYSLEVILQQTTAKIVWLHNSPNHLLDLLQEWFPDKAENSKNKEKKKSRPCFIVKNINTFRKYLELLMYKGKAIITGHISEEVYQKIKRKVLRLYCPENQQLKEFKSMKKSETTFKVEVVENNDLMRFTHPIYFTKTPQRKEIQKIAQDKLLERSSQNNFGNINWVIAEAGMGKTSLLDELKRRWQILEANCSYDWVFPISLTKIQEKDITSTTNLEDFLLDLTPVADQNREWIKMALRHDLSAGRILLLLDAWDEVKPASYENLKIILSKIPQKVSFIIGTRPCGLDSMHLSGWNNEYFELQKFSENLIREYVVKFFTKKTPGQLSESHFKDLAAEVWNWTKNCKSELSQILTTPLRIFQICEILSGKLTGLSKDFDNDVSKWFLHNRPCELATLYEKFIFAGFFKFDPGVLEKADSKHDPQVLEETGAFYDGWDKHLNFLSIEAYRQLSL